MNLTLAKSEKNAIGTLLLGAVCISLSPIFIKAAGAAPDSSAFYRMLFTLVSNYVWVKIARKDAKVKGRSIFYLSLGAIFLSLDFMCWHRSIILVGPGLATLLANLQVFFTAIFSYLILKQRISWTLAIAIPIAVVGLALIVGIDVEQPVLGTRSGLFMGVMAAFFYSGYILLLNAAMRSSEVRGAVAMLIVSAVCTIFLGAMVIANGITFHLPSIGSFFILACAGVLGTSFGWGLISTSMKLVNVTTASFILLLQPTLAFIWDVLFFSKTLQRYEVWGVLMVLLAISLGASVNVKTSQ